MFNTLISGLETICPLGKHLRQLEACIAKKLRSILHGRNQGKPNSWCRELLKVQTVESALRVQRVKLFGSILDMMGDLCREDAQLPALLLGKGLTRDSEQ